MANCSSVKSPLARFPFTVASLLAFAIFWCSSFLWFFIRVRRRTSPWVLLRFSRSTVFQTRLVVRFSVMQVFINHNCSRILSFTKDVSINCLRSRFAWSAFDRLCENSRIAFCDMLDKLGFGITIMIAWRQEETKFFL